MGWMYQTQTVSKTYTATLTIIGVTEHTDNRSRFSWKLEWSNTTQIYTKGSDKFTITINGNKVYAETRKDLIFTDYNQTMLVAQSTEDIIVDHDASGNAKLTFKLDYKNAGTTGSTRPSTKAGTLQTVDLPRCLPTPYATIAETDISFGDTINISIPEDGEGLVHKLYFNQSLISTLPSGMTNAQYVIPVSVMNDYPNDNTVACSIMCTTVIEGVEYGYRVTGFTVGTNRVQNALSPVISFPFVYDEMEETLNTPMFLKGISKLIFSFQAKCVSNATLVRSWLEHNGKKYDGTIIDQTKNGSNNFYFCEVNIGLITDYVEGEFQTFNRRLYVQDSRGFISTYDFNYVIYDYYVPKLLSFELDRCLEDGTFDDTNGTYAKVSIELDSVPLDGMNDTSLFIEVYDELSQQWIVRDSFNGVTIGNVTSVFGVFDLETTYRIRARFYDIVSANNNYVLEKELYLAYSLINFGEDGKSIAFGKQSSNNGTIESSIPFDIPLAMRTAGGAKATSEDTVVTWIKAGTGVFYYNTNVLIEQPSQYGYLFNFTNGTSSVIQYFFNALNGVGYFRWGTGAGWNGKNAQSGLWNSNIHQGNVINSLAVTGEGWVLDARQGKAIDDRLKALENKKTSWVEVARVKGTSNQTIEIPNLEDDYSELLLVCINGTNNVKASIIIPMEMFKISDSKSEVHRAYYTSSYNSEMIRTAENTVKMKSSSSAYSAVLYAK